MTDYSNCSFENLSLLSVEELNLYITTGLLITPNDWGVKSLDDFEYGKVMELLMMFDKDINLEDMAKICELIYEKPVNLKKWYYVFAFYNWILSEVKAIEDKLKTLYIAPTSEESQAGIENFQEFGAFATIDRLAGGDVLKYDAIERMPFNLIFTKMKLNKVTYEFDDNLRKIYLAKNR
ncbi:MAG: hypothetical protein WC139_12880 [Candidatus Kapaibacterium sp.]